MLPPRSTLDPASRRSRSPPATKPKKGEKRKREEDSEDEDEFKTFKRRPKAAVNRPMIQPPVDKVRKQRIELSIAQLDPSASFEERVAQFDQLEAIAKKRKSKGYRVMSST